jgi:hypothetical protein
MLVVEQPHGKERASVGEPSLRGADRTAEAGLERRRHGEGGGRGAPFARFAPHARDRAQALPRDGLGMEAEHSIGDVGRVPLAVEQAVGARVDLPGERVDVRPEYGRHLGDVRAVADAAHVLRHAEEPLASLPVRVRRRSRGE